MDEKKWAAIRIAVQSIGHTTGMADQLRMRGWRSTRAGGVICAAYLAARAWVVNRHVAAIDRSMVEWEE